MAQAITASEDQAPFAHHYIETTEARGYEWAAPVIHEWFFPMMPVGAALLAGLGARVANGYAASVRSSHRPDLRLVDVPAAERTHLDISMLSWLALLRCEWRPFSDRNRRRTRPDPVDELRETTASGDRAAIKKAIGRMVRVYDSAKERGELNGKPFPSVLEFALRRVVLEGAGTKGLTNSMAG
jgi:hypothetical protein